MIHTMTVYAEFLNWVWILIYSRVSLKLTKKYYCTVFNGNTLFSGKYQWKWTKTVYILLIQNSYRAIFCDNLTKEYNCKLNQQKHDFFSFILKWQGILAQWLSLFHSNRKWMLREKLCSSQWLGGVINYMRHTLLVFGT